MKLQWFIILANPAKKSSLQLGISLESRRVRFNPAKVSDNYDKYKSCSDGSNKIMRKMSREKASFSSFFLLSSSSAHVITMFFHYNTRAHSHSTVSFLLHHHRCCVSCCRNSLAFPSPINTTLKSWRDLCGAERHGCFNKDNHEKCRVLQKCFCNVRSADEFKKHSSDLAALSSESCRL